MIAIDSSAIAAVILREPEAELFAKMIADNDCVIGSPTLFEVTIVMKPRTNVRHHNELARLLSLKNVAVVEFTRRHADVAQAAHERFGKGIGHPARLNFGDCMAYAIASVASVPLLFKGNDFIHTDVVPAWTP